MQLKKILSLNWSIPYLFSRCLWSEMVTSHVQFTLFYLLWCVDILRLQSVAQHNDVALISLAISCDFRGWNHYTLGSQEVSLFTLAVIQPRWGLALSVPFRRDSAGDVKESEYSSIFLKTELLGDPYFYFLLKLDLGFKLLTNADGLTHQLFIFYKLQNQDPFTFFSFFLVNNVYCI